MNARAGVHFAAVQGEGVLLDTVGDTYIGLTATSARLWRALEGGADRDQLAAVAREAWGLPADEAESLVRAQLEVWSAAGLVEEAPSPRPIALPGAHPRTSPHAALDGSALDRTPLSPWAVASLWVSAAVVSIGLTRAGVYALIRRQQALPASGASLGEIYTIQRAHRFLRRFTNQGKQDCVRRSLVLARTLRRRGVDARICIGVQKFPFLAHAWVEADGVVVDEPLEVARRFVVVAVF